MTGIETAESSFKFST